MELIEKRLDRLEGRRVSIGVNPSGMFQLQKGAVVETFYDYERREQVSCTEPLPVVAESGWYTARLQDGQPVLEFHGSK